MEEGREGNSLAGPAAIYTMMEVYYQEIASGSDYFYELISPVLTTLRVPRPHRFAAGYATRAQKLDATPMKETSDYFLLPASKKRLNEPE